MHSERRTVNLDEAAAMLGIGRTKFRAMVRADELPAPLKVIRFGRRTVIPLDSIDALLAPATEE